MTNNFAEVAAFFVWERTATGGVKYSAHDIMAHPAQSRENKHWLIAEFPLAAIEYKTLTLDQLAEKYPCPKSKQQT